MKFVRRYSLGLGAVICLVGVVMRIGCEGRLLVKMQAIPTQTP